jgi:hypothetical protein
MVNLKMMMMKTKMMKMMMEKMKMMKMMMKMKMVIIPKIFKIL